MAKKEKRFVKIYSETTAFEDTAIWSDKETGVNYLWIESGYAGGLTPLLDAEGLAKLQEIVADTYVGEPVIHYIVALINGTRNNPNILRGASPRATLAVTAMAKAVAQLRGRDYVTPKDVQEVFLRTVAHRLLLAPKAEAAGMTPYQILEQVMIRVPAPKTT